MTPASQKARICRERAAVTRLQSESALTLAEREQCRAIELRCLQFARLYELMDEVLVVLDQSEEDSTLTA
jgi:hypothetical protein